METFLSIVIVIAFGWIVYSRYSKKKKVEKAKEEAKSAEEKARNVEKAAKQAEKQALLKKNRTHSFSVSKDQKVKFSPGSLQYQPSTNTWCFAENQYDCISEDDTKDISPLYNGWMDRFCWGTGDCPTNVSNINKTYSNFVDWGENKIGDNPMIWRTLSVQEWMYLTFGRPNAANLVGFGNVNSQSGLILLPDDWTFPSDINFIPIIRSGFKPVKEGGSPVENLYLDITSNHQYVVNNYSIEGWQVLEKMGAVFLAGPIGWWSSTASEFRGGPIDYAFSLLFFDEKGLTVANAPRNTRMCVRLVRNV